MRCFKIPTWTKWRNRNARDSYCYDDSNGNGSTGGWRRFKSTSGSKKSSLTSIGIALALARVILAMRSGPGRQACSAQAMIVMLMVMVAVMVMVAELVPVIVVARRCHRPSSPWK
jgi:hypothetical protein